MPPHFALIPLFWALVTFLPPSPPPLEGLCQQVLDGDTLKVAGKTIRLAHIDAPELSQRSRWGVPVGQLSARFLTTLALHRPLRIELLNKDIYGRWLGRVWLNQTHINLQMVLHGQAYAYGFRKKPRGVFQWAQHLAKAKRRGLWQYRGVQRPWSYRRRQKNRRVPAKK